MEFWNAFEKLLVLRITLDLGTSRPVLMTLQRPSNDRLNDLKSWSFATIDFGLPSDEAREASSSRRFDGRLPSGFTDELKATLANMSEVQSSAPLWLQFVSPCGSLPIVPFEAELTDALGRPVIRLAALQAPPPAEFAETLEVAICSSMPISKSSFPVQEYIESFVAAFSKVPRRLNVHVFTDMSMYDSLSRKTLVANIHLHPPENASRYNVPKREPQIGASEAIENPWLRWISDSLTSQPLDAVCFINHGYYSVDHGAIAFAQSPIMNEDNGWARFIGAAQLGRFLSQTGAWCVILGSPLENYSDAGSRMLLEEVSQIHPGYAILHDLSLDSQCSGLDVAFQSLFGSQQFAPPLHQSLTVYATPSTQVENECLFLPIGFESLPAIQLQQASLSIQQHAENRQSLRDLVQQAETPRWMVAAERFLTGRRLESSQPSPDEVDSESVMFSRAKETLDQIEAIIRSYPSQQLPTSVPPN